MMRQRGRKGPTRVLYLLGTGAAAPGGWDEAGAGMAVVAAVEAGSAMAAVAGAVEAGSAAAATAERGLELSVREGEEWRTLGRKVCPPWVFTMVRLERERRWRGELQMGNENVN